MSKPVRIQVNNLAEKKVTNRSLEWTEFQRGGLVEHRRLNINFKPMSLCLISAWPRSSMKSSSSVRQCHVHYEQFPSRPLEGNIRHVLIFFLCCSTHFLYFGTLFWVPLFSFVVCLSCCWALLVLVIDAISSLQFCWIFLALPFV